MTFADIPLGEPHRKEIMSIVKFAVICDQCGSRGPEYGPTWHCTECLDHVCPKCAPCDDPETDRTICHQCAEEMGTEDEDQRLDDPRHGQAAGLNRSER